MHIPDGFIDPATSAAAGVVAVGGLAWCLGRGGAEVDDEQVPLAGLVAAFVFAVQMLNFPVASGTSGHLMGGALAAVLVGPRLGTVCVAVVAVVQTLVFADGGVSALGLNVLNMALVTTFGGWAVFALLRRLLPRTRSAVAVASGIAAGVAVVLSSVAFAVEFAIGGTGAASAGTVLGAMVGVHVLIGIGEGVITGLAVSAVLAARPDLVYGARHLPAPRLLSPAAAPVAGAR